jgi:hypothetical protein
MIEKIKELEQIILSAKKEIFEAYNSFKYVVYTQERISWNIQDNLKHTENVIVRNNDYYHFLYSNSLADAIILCNSNGWRVYSVNNNTSEYWNQISSFIRKNYDVIKSHEFSSKLEEFLSTGNLLDFQVVYQIIKGIV